MSGLVSTPRLNNWLLFHVMSNAQVSSGVSEKHLSVVLLGSLEGVSCLCQELVCCIIFLGMVQHLAQQPSRLCPCKVSRVIPWDVSVPAREI